MRRLRLAILTAGFWSGAIPMAMLQASLAWFQ